MNSGKAKSAGATPGADMLILSQARGETPGKVQRLWLSLGRLRWPRRQYRHSSARHLRRLVRGDEEIVHPPGKPGDMCKILWPMRPCGFESRPGHPKRREEPASSLANSRTSGTARLPWP